VKSWKIGSFKVTEIPEFPIEVGLLDGLVAQATPDVVLGIDWMCPDYANEQGQTLWDIHSYVVEAGDKTILIDAGCGNGKNYPMQPIWTGLDLPFLERLNEAGYSRDDIDIVLITHLHLDHVGWCSMRNETGAWVPTFPNARLMLVRGEYERHLSQILAHPADGAADRGTDVVDDSAEDDVDLIARAFHADTDALSIQTALIQEESLQPVVDAGLLDLVETDAQIVPGVEYVSTPGHTSHHHSVRLTSGDQSAFITGDFIHHPIQIARPDWSSQGDWDPDASARNRRALLEQCAGTDLLILGTHFTGAGAGYIVADGQSYKLVSNPR